MKLSGDFINHHMTALSSLFGTQCCAVVLYHVLSAGAMLTRPDASLTESIFTQP